MPTQPSTHSFWWMARPWHAPMQQQMPICSSLPCLQERMLLLLCSMGYRVGWETAMDARDQAESMMMMRRREGTRRTSGGFWRLQMPSKSSLLEALLMRRCRLQTGNVVARKARAEPPLPPCPSMCWLSLPPRCTASAACLHWTPASGSTTSTASTITARSLTSLPALTTQRKGQQVSPQIGWCGQALSPKSKPGFITTSSGRSWRTSSSSWSRSSSSGGISRMAAATPRCSCPCWRPWAILEQELLLPLWLPCTRARRLPLPVTLGHTLL
mmetsp:Transcript_8876/g.23919  ORF Transcript_8876/g.23919 Transcript_8876/m.23919 type:complete len:271 (+) Transcript_8876:923-1735(+)